MISASEFHSAVGKRLKLFRLAIGRSQKDFGDRLGVGDTAISNYETAKRALDPYDAWKLNMFFGLPLEWVFWGDESMIAPPLLAKLAAAKDRQRRERRPSSKKKGRAAA